MGRGNSLRLSRLFGSLGSRLALASTSGGQGVPWLGRWPVRAAGGVEQAYGAVVVALEEQTVTLVEV